MPHPPMRHSAPRSLPFLGLSETMRGAAPRHPRPESVHEPRPLIFPLHNRQMEIKSRAFAWRALCADSTAVRLHDAFADGKAQSHAFAFLRCKKRTKDVRQRIWLDTDARVGNRDRQLTVTSAAFLTILCGLEKIRRCPKLELAAFRHRLRRVKSEVDQNLTQLLGIG